ncbi:MAG: AIR synthase related protein, partial [Naasia sp.]
AAATNLADIAAMGARPTALVVALAAPLSTPLTVLEGIADGLREGCAALAPGSGVVGGDLSASDTLTLALTVFGDLDGRDPVTRSGARVGDTLAVAGDLGRAGAGLALLFRDGVDADRTPDSGRAGRLRAAFPELLEAQLRPRPPIRAGVPASLGGATAMLDVSDGLLLDARRIAEASGVTLDISSAALEPDTALLARPALGFDADRRMRLVLAGGEDHALLATFPPGPLPEGFRPLGRVRPAAQPGAAAGAAVAVSGVTLDGDPVDGRTGWDPFDDWDGLAG